MFLEDKTYKRKTMESLVFLEKSHEFLPVLVMGGLAFGGAILLIGLSFLRGSGPTRQKKPIPSYEGGFPPFESAPKHFDVRFYLIALLFVLFNLVFTFLIPWALSFSEIGFFGCSMTLSFLMLLAFGFFYAWRKGALDWE